MATNAYIHQVLPGEQGGALLFVLHGTGGDERQLLGLGRDLLPDATVVGARGAGSENGAARVFRRAAAGGYDMDDLARAAAKLAGFVRAHVAALAPSAVYALGYSNGANVLAATLFAEPDLFDRAVLMHPLIPFEPEVSGSLAGRAILVTAGRHDPICPPTLTSRLEAYLRAFGADVEVVWHPGAHEVRTEEIEAARAFLHPAAGGSGEKRQAMSETFDIRLEEGDSKGRYVVDGPDGSVAEMTFTKVGSKQVIIDHTGVPDIFRGKGVGALLVARAVEDARAAGKTIIPLCPFAAAQFRRHPEWADVLKK